MNAAQNGESEPRGPTMEKQNNAVQNGLGDMYLALKRMLAGDGHKRAWWNVHMSGSRR